MATSHFVKDYCPFAANQGFLSVVGDVIPGETVFGFTYASTGTNTISFASVTGQQVDAQGKGIIVNQMQDIKYRVIATRVSGVSGSKSAPIISAKTKVGFTMAGVSGQSYDVVVIGKVQY